MSNKKVNKKKISSKELVYILSSLLLVAVFWCLISFSSYFSGSDEDNSIDGYYKYEHFNYSISLSNNIYYSKYYYRDTDNEKYLKEYDKVNEENIEMIKEFYNNFKNIMIEQEKTYIFDLNENDIDYDDYYIIHEFCDPEDKKYSCYRYHSLSLKLYDTQSHILYFLQNIEYFER